MKKIHYLLTSAGLLSVCLIACSKSVTPPNELTYKTIGSDNYSIHTELQEGFLNSEYPSSYLSQHDLIAYDSYSTSRDVTITWEVETDNQTTPPKYIFELSEKSDFVGDSESFVTKKNNVTLSNLRVNTDYYYRVTSYYDEEHQFVSDTQTFRAGDKLRNINVEGVENMRDIGGYDLENGHKIKQGLIYRSAQFNYPKPSEDDRYDPVISKPTKKGLSTLKDQLKIKTEIDLRKDTETDGITSSPIGKNVNYVHLPMTYGNTDVLTNEVNHESIVAFFDLLADENNYPLVFHCIQGKDRTGALAFVLGTLLGATYEDMVLDYLFSNFAKIGSKATGTSHQYVIDGYAGETRREKTINYLTSEAVGIQRSVIDKIISILEE